MSDKIDMRGNRVRPLPKSPKDGCDERPLEVASPPVVPPKLLANTWVVVCVHNRADVAIPCLEILHARTPLNVNVVVVDDASDPHCAELLVETLERMEGRYTDLIRHDVNVKYTRAINSGFVYARERGARWLVSLNSDTRVTDGWVQRMIATGESDAKIGIVCPYISDAALITLELAPGASYIETARRLSTLAPGSRPDAVTPVGACMMVRDALWDKLGPFDEHRCPEGYGEECWLWANAVNAGWLAVLADDAYIYHESHASYGRSASEREDKAVRDFKAEHLVLLDSKFIGARQDDPRPELRVQMKQHRTKVDLDQPQVAFYLPHVEMCGGLLAIVHVINGLAERGIGARLVYKHDEERELTIPDNPAAGRRITPMLAAPIRVATDDPGEWVRRGAPSRCLLFATAWMTGTYVRKLCAAKRDIRPCAFVQDREDLFKTAKDEMYYPQGIPADYMWVLKQGHSIVNSGWVRKTAERDLDVSLGKYIPIGVDPLLFYDRRVRSTGRRVRVMAFYRPETPRRGGDLLERLYRELYKRFREKIDLAVYGSAEMKADFPVMYMGTLPQPELAVAMGYSHALCDPSDLQGWGMPGQEGMASGCGVVMLKNGGVDNYGVHDRNCLIAEDDDELIAYMVRLVESEIAHMADPEKESICERLGKQAAIDMRRFAWPNVCDRWAETIRDWWTGAFG